MGTSSLIRSFTQVTKQPLTRLSIKKKSSTYSGPLESHTQCATTTVPGGRLLPNRRQGGVHKDRPSEKRETVTEEQK